MNFEIKGGNNCEEHFDDLQLNLVVSLGHTITNRFNYCIDKFARQTPIHIGCWLLIIWVDAIVFTVAVQKFIRYQFLNDIEKTFHQFGYLCIKT